MSEKAVSIGNYVVATGIDTFLGVDPYTKGSTEVTELLQGEHDPRLASGSTSAARTLRPSAA